jgi:hypothetical protein
VGQEGGGEVAKPAYRRLFPLAALGIGITWLGAIEVFFDSSRQAEMMEGIVLFVSLLPVAVSMLARHFLALSGAQLSARVLKLVSLTLTLGLSIPYWLWLEKLFWRRFERKVSQRVS